MNKMILLLSSVLFLTTVSIEASPHHRYRERYRPDTVSQQFKSSPYPDYPCPYAFEQGNFVRNGETIPCICGKNLVAVLGIFPIVEQKWDCNAGTTTTSSTPTTSASTELPISIPNGESPSEVQPIAESSTAITEISESL